VETNEVTAQPEAAVNQAVSESPEVAVTVKPLTKSEARRQARAAKLAAMLAVKTERAVTIIGEQAEMLREVRRVLTPYLAEMHGSWGYVQFDRKLVETETAELAKMGFYWSQNRNGWRRPGLGGQSGNGKSLDEIRAKYGCTVY
jgi:hypothetical protein